MTRGGFLKGLFTLIVAPKILVEIEFKNVASLNVANLVAPANAKIFSDLNLLIPTFYKQYAERYGNESYELLATMLLWDEKPLNKQ